MNYFKFSDNRNALAKYDLETKQFLALFLIIIQSNKDPD